MWKIDEESGPNPDEVRAELGGEGRVAAHPHGELAAALVEGLGYLIFEAPGELARLLEDLSCRAMRAKRAHGHQSTDADGGRFRQPQSGGGGLVPSEAVLLILPGQVDLDEDVDLAPELLGNARDGVREALRVDRVQDVHVLQDPADLVALQVPDEVPPGLETRAGEAFGSSSERVRPILSEVPAAGVEDPRRDVVVHSLGHRDQGWSPPTRSAGRLIQHAADRVQVAHESCPPGVHRRRTAVGAPIGLMDGGWGQSEGRRHREGA